MGRTLGSSALQFLLSVFLLWTFLFFFLRLLPGGPFDDFETQLSPSMIERLNSHYKLDQPLTVQYIHDLSNLLRGDLGFSMTSPDKKNSEIILSKINTSFLLGGVALFFSFTIFFSFWIFCTVGRISERQILNVSYFLTSLPTLLVAPLILWVVSIRASFLQLSDPLVSMTLGAFVLSLRMSGVWLRLYYLEQIELKSSVSSQFLRSLGHSESRIKAIWLSKSCLLPTITLALPSIASLLAGSLLIETIFNISGIGAGLVTSLLDRDYTLVTSYVLIFGVLYILSQFLFEILAKYLDPRINV